MEEGTAADDYEFDVLHAQQNVPTLPEFMRNTACVYTNPISHGGGSHGHYKNNAETYMDVGLAMGRVMVDLLEKGNEES